MQISLHTVKVFRASSLPYIHYITRKTRLKDFRFTFQLLTVLVILAYVVLSGGCTSTKVAEQQAQKAMEENVQLQSENARLNAELEEKNILAARLQMELVKKQEQIGRLKSITQQSLAKEIASNTIRTPAATTKVETVAYLAEIATEIETFRETSTPDQQETYEKADKLIQESNNELEKERFEQASLLAAQAMELINRQRADSPSVSTLKGQPYSDFISPLELKLAKRSNIRKSPGSRSKLIATVDPGTSVVATGHKGYWIKVTLPDGRSGWVYYSLLSIPKDCTLPKE